MTNRQRPGKDPVTFDNLLAGASAAQRTVRICTRGDLLGEIDALNEELAQAVLDDGRLNRTPQAPALAKEIMELSDEAKASEVEFTFRAVGRRAWRDLAAAHPPTPEQKKLGADINTDTFPPAAMAASCVAPEGATVEAFEQLADAAWMTDAQWNRLWVACHSVNNDSGSVPFSAAAYALARPSETSSE